MRKIGTKRAKYCVQANLRVSRTPGSYLISCAIGIFTSIMILDLFAPPIGCKRYL